MSVQVRLQLLLSLIILCGTSLGQISQHDKIYNPNETDTLPTEAEGIAGALWGHVQFVPPTTLCDSWVPRGALFGFLGHPLLGAPFC